MTMIKERAVEMIQRMPEENMLYVMNILQNLEAMSADKEKDKQKAETALKNILEMEKGCRKTLIRKKNCRKREWKNMIILVDTDIILDVL